MTVSFSLEKVTVLFSNSKGVQSAFLTKTSRSNHTREQYQRCNTVVVPLH